MFTLSAIIFTIVSPLLVPVTATVFHAIAGARQRSPEEETQLRR
ncbi:MAG TPA: hypothetical protein VGF65_17935 [Mycobacterium sp.]|jgi:hypothetical protein